MPYVMRDDNGGIVRCAAGPQEGDWEYKDDKDSELIAFNSRFEPGSKVDEFHQPVFRGGQWVEGMSMEDRVKIHEGRVRDLRVRVNACSGLGILAEEQVELAKAEAELAKVKAE